MLAERQRCPPLSVLSTCVTKQTGDMVYSEPRRLSLLSFRQRLTMLYALEREFHLGSMPAVFVESSEGRDVGSGPMSRVWDIAVRLPTAGSTVTTRRDQKAPSDCHASCRSSTTRRVSSSEGVNHSGDISWHKTRIFIGEVFRFEELAFELVTPGFYRVYFRDMEIGGLNVEELCLRAARRLT